MKIYNNVKNVIGLYINNTPTEKTSDRRNSANQDEVRISQTVKDISRYIDIALNTEITNEKVDEIMHKVVNKEYKVDSRELARAILVEINGSGDM